MSHAGQFLELAVLGRWWADIPTEEWPAESTDEILLDFADGWMEEKQGQEQGKEQGQEQEQGQGPGSLVGDRRQELVFIGQVSVVPILCYLTSFSVSYNHVMSTRPPACLLTYSHYLHSLTFTLHTNTRVLRVSSFFLNSPISNLHSSFLLSYFLVSYFLVTCTCFLATCTCILFCFVVSCFLLLLY